MSFLLQFSKFKETKNPEELIKKFTPFMKSEISKHLFYKRHRSKNIPLYDSETILDDCMMKCIKIFEIFRYNDEKNELENERILAGLLKISISNLIKVNFSFEKKKKRNVLSEIVEIESDQGSAVEIKEDFLKTIESREVLETVKGKISIESKKILELSIKGHKVSSISKITGMRNDVVRDKLRTEIAPAILKNIDGNTKVYC